MSPPKTDSSSSAPSSKPQIFVQRPDKHRWLGLTLILAGVALVSATAGALLAVSLASTPLLQSNISSEDAEIFAEDESISTDTNFRLPSLTRPVNILVLGVKVLASDLADPPDELNDLGYDALVDSFEGLSDTMLLVRFNPQTGQVVLLSIPRDTRTWVEGVGTTKLNSANAYGGPALAARATSELLGGVEIDRYIRINVQGVEKLIDALGGVTVYVPHDMKYQDDSQHLYINLKQGEQHLDGNKALQFLRFRYDQNGDIGRVQRQQAFMRALAEQSLNIKTVARLPRILSVIQENVDTNLTVEELVALVGFAAQAGRSNTQMLMLPGDFSSPGAYELSYWIPDTREIGGLTAQYFDAEPGYISEVLPQSLSIVVQNFTDVDEALDRAVTQLGEAGYSNVYTDSIADERLPTTRIIAQRGDRSSAQLVQQALGIGEVVVESTGALQSDITIQLGQDWQTMPIDSVDVNP